MTSSDNPLPSDQQDALPGPVVRIAPRALAKRGDRVARFYFFVGVGAYVVLAGVIGATLILNSSSSVWEAAADLVGLGGEHRNWAVLFLVGIGLALTMLSCSRVWMDIRSLGKEEDDVEWVATHGREGLLLVFEDRSARLEMLRRMRRDGTHYEISKRAQVETLIDERVRRLHLSAEGAEVGLIGAAELRSIAEVRTSEYGGFARHAVSMLLLVAVLGTFAGIKTALPQLTQAIATSTESPDALVDNGVQEDKAGKSLQSALSAVAAAFGGNALALVGAVAVGLMAQGVSFGRRNLLERLELVSMEYIYDQSTTSEGSPLQGAINRLGDAVIAMREQTSAMDRVGDDLSSLGVSFATSFERLEQRLHELVTQHDETLYTRTADSLDELRGRIGEVVRLSEANGIVYAGLAEAVRARSTETTNALNEMRGTNERLTSALGGILNASALAVESSKALAASVDEMSRGSRSVGEQTTQLTGVVESIGITVGNLTTTLAQTDARLRAFEADSLQHLRQVGERAADQIQGAAEPLRAISTALLSAESRIRELGATPRTTPETRGVASERSDRTEVILAEIRTAMEESRRASMVVGWTTIGAIVAVGVGAMAVAAMRFGWL